jgi:hypothetical protein
MDRTRTQNKMVQPGIRRHQESKELARNKKGKVVVIQKRSQSFLSIDLYKIWETIIEEEEDDQVFYAVKTQ